MGTYKRLEDLEVYQKLCRLHIEICALSHRWPPEEKFELGSQIRHLYMSLLKGYETQATFDLYRERYHECVRMLNGLEKTLEQYVPETERRWPAAVRETSDVGLLPDSGYPEPLTLTPIS